MYLGLSFVNAIVVIHVIRLFQYGTDICSILSVGAVAIQYYTF